MLRAQLSQVADELYKEQQTCFISFLNESKDWNIFIHLFVG